MRPETAVMTAAIVVFLLAIRKRGSRRRHSWLYRHYMGSRLWRFRRWIWYVTSNRRCEKCGRLMALHKSSYLHRLGAPVMTVHHRTYKRLGRERRSDVVLACWPCHKGMDSWRHR